MSSPRIISGSARGYRLQSVPGNITRPITDRVKEALFNIIGADITGCEFLDLFAGTGSVGIEALSRGAQYVCMIDKNRKAYETILLNLERTGLSDRSELFLMDAFTYLKKPGSHKFDYIFIAPPQYKNLWAKALEAIGTSPSLLHEDGWVIVQIDPLEYRPVETGEIKEFDPRKYGDSLLVFYR
jgi:16S rRNA (guanine966-N2)-methyltransferase